LYVGAFSSFAAIIAVQTDIKRVLAFSTMSQNGIYDVSLRHSFWIHDGHEKELVILLCVPFVYARNV
jgi:NADH:ubiquinone oxidoreductase subunit 2 (subunit N)